MTDEIDPAPTPATSPKPTSTAARIIPWIVRIVLPIIVAVITWRVYVWIEATKPVASRQQPPRPVAQVDVVRVAQADFTVQLPSRGTVQAEVGGDLVAQVSGVITYLSPAFKDGGTFAAGEVLVRLDPRDYEVAIAESEAEIKRATIAVEQARITARQVAIEVTQYETSVQTARAALADARRALEEETARGEQAAAEWRQLNGDTPPPDLVVRKPQLTSAKASIASAEAQLAQRIADQGLAAPRIAAAEAEISAREAALGTIVTKQQSLQLDLERTEIRAPYGGRIRQREVDAGQFVGVGKRLATLYSTESAEVRLPLTNRQLGFVDVPVGQDLDPATLPPVLLSATHGNRSYDWHGTIVRTDGVMDPTTRQLYVFARVADPYAAGLPGQPPLRVGMYVSATIQGDTLEGVYVVPRSAVRGDNELFIVDEATMELTRRSVEPIWSDDEVIVLREGLQPGELLCVSPVVFIGQRLPVQARWAETGELLVDPAANADSAGEGKRGKQP